MEVQWPDWNVDGTNRAGVLTDHATIEFRRTSPCIKPFREFTIYSDGLVQPCCEAFHDSAVTLVEIADLHKASIFEAYSSRQMANFRRHLIDFSPKSGICASCTVPDYSSPASDSERKSLLEEAIHE